MSIVYLGTSGFAAAVLSRLASEQRLRPALVLTRPDRPAGRGRRLTPPPVAVRARELGLRVEQPASVNDEHGRALIASAGDGGASSERPDGARQTESARQTVVVCAFGALIKEPLLSEHEILNIHPSLLPRWRGAAPVERAIMAGDKRTGVSIMRLTAGLDSGPVCLQAEEPITPQDSYGSLAERLQALAGELIVRALLQRPPFHEQSEEGVTYAEKIEAADRLLDPARAASDLERVVRALHPHIGARVALPDGTLLGVQRAALAPAAAPGASAPGEPRPPGVFVAGGRLLLACTPGLLELLEVKPPGARAMDAAAYLRGHEPSAER